MRKDFKMKMIESEIMKILSEAIREMKDPRIQSTILTITSVRVSKDKKYADIYVSCFGDVEKRTEVVDFLNSRKGFLRTHLSKSLRMYSTPELRFIRDDGIEESIRINKLIDSISKDNKTSDDKEKV